jgi:DNA-binding response OmpR family regulator
MPQTVLLIDDDRLFLETARGFLERNGFQVQVATSWVDFTKGYYGGSATPDIILFDVNLGPTVPGDRLLYVFKEGRKNLASAKKTKLVLLSGLPEEELNSRARLCGADGYIRKESLTIKSGAAFLERLRSFLT